MYGDLRGFRTRHHREHIDGDYRALPAREEYETVRRHSRESLVQPPVCLAPEWRARIGELLQVEFQRLGAWVLILAVATQHAHLLAKLPPGPPRILCGRVKRRVTIRTELSGWQGKLWGVRSKAIRIRDRAHQENTYRYIRAHAAEGAWVGEWRVEPDRLNLDDC